MHWSIRAAAVAIAMGAIRLPSPAALAAPQEPIRIHVDDPRPVAAAVLEVAKRFGRIVTYEDTSYVHPGDIVDVTETVRRDGDMSKRILVMRSGIVDVTVTPRSSATDDDTIREVLQQIVTASKAAGNTGDFTVQSRPGGFHVVPTARKGMSGALEPYASPLETRVTLPYRDESGFQFMERFTAALSTALGRAVVPNAPINLFLQKRVAIKAENEVARDVLWRALQSIQDRLSWQLLCDVGERGMCAINIRAVPGRW